MRLFGIAAVLAMISLQSALAGNATPPPSNLHHSWTFKTANTHSPTGGLMLMINIEGAIPSLNQDLILAGRRIFLSSGSIPSSAVYSGPVNHDKVGEGWGIFLNECVHGSVSRCTYLIRTSHARPAN